MASSGTNTWKYKNAHGNIDMIGGSTYGDVSYWMGCIDVGVACWLRCVDDDVA
jgi:hypothetical protein